MQGVESAAFAFDRACARAGLSYAFVGGLAVMAWGHPRASSLVRQEGKLDLAKLRALATRLGVDRALDVLLEEG